MLKSSRQSGASLVELLIGLGIMALLLLFGVPQFTVFMNNARLRSTAESLATGINLARAEAVKRNNRVEFVLTNEEPIAALVNALPASTSGINWVVRERVSAGSYTFIEGKDGSEGSGQVEATPVTISSTSADATYAGILTFTGFGALTTGQSVQFQITNPSGGNCAHASTPGPMRCLTINVAPGGQVRVCDPKVTDTKDTRIC